LISRITESELAVHMQGHQRRKQWQELHSRFSEQGHEYKLSGPGERRECMPKPQERAAATFLWQINSEFS
jgi:hypothetical protein